MKRWEPIGRWGKGLLVALPLVLAIAGCAGTANAPDGSESGGSGLGGQMIGKRGTVLGNVGGAGQPVGLHMATGETCDSATAAQQTTTSQPDGSFSFPSTVDQGGSYCIEYGGQTHVCNCQWNNDSCDCSPAAGP